MLELELLQVAIGNRRALSHKPSSKDWLGIYGFGKRHSILGVLFSGIERLPKHQLPGKELLMDWFGQTEYLARLNRLLDARTAELTKMMAEGGMRSCVLKGQGVAQLYPNPQRRSCGDIDLWVEGTRNEVLRMVKNRWTVGDVLMYHVDAKVFDDAVVEIHYVPAFSFNPLRYRRYLKFFEAVSKVQFQLVDTNLGFAHPSIDFHAVYSLIHIFNHALNNEVRLKQVVDYYYILSRMDTMNKERVMKTILWFGLERFAGALMWVLTECLDMSAERLLCAPNEKAGRLLLKDIMQDEKAVYETRREGTWGAFVIKMKKLATYITFYPSEVLWAPVWKLWHWGWMKKWNK